MNYPALYNWLSLKVFFALVFGSLFIVYFSELQLLAKSWLSREEYSHGLFIPIIAAYILWQRRHIISSIKLIPSWNGVVILGFAFLLLFGAVLADIESAKNYSLIIALLGIVLAFGGRPLLKECLFPILLLLFVIPLPYLLNSTLTAQLQLVSSELGVWFIRLINVPVFLEGNIIDLGGYKLQVAEACSGLNYLYPLISFGLIVAYFYKAPFWQRALIVASTVPITIFMNSLRIGVIGILVNSYGIAAAEGFLHDFEGWIVFMGASALLVFEVWLLTLLQKTGPKFLDVFSIGFETKSPATARRERNTVPTQALIALLIIMIGGIAVYQINDGEDVIPERAMFDTFPLNIGARSAEQGFLPSLILDVLKSDDYFLGDYWKDKGDAVSLYMVYYSKQKEGSALHSPRVCLPGGGWNVIENAEQVIPMGAKTGKVVRVVMKQGDYMQLVYYWIQQQGQVFTNEYLARASLLVSAVKENRTDGSLIRVNTRIEGDDIGSADKRLQKFVQEISPYLPRYIPE